MESLLESLHFAEDIARRSGALLLSRWESLRTIERKATVTDLVTDADRASEALIVGAIRERFPEDGIVGEEGTGTLSQLHDKGRVWVVDPLDGTINYAHRLPIFSVSIAMLEGGVPQLGVVYLPALSELFCAAVGRQTTCNGSPQQVSTREALQESVVATGFPYDKHLSARDNVANHSQVVKRVRGIRRMGSAAVDLAYVAAGRLDGYWEEKIKPWDIAAGILLVTQAGGRVTRYRGEPLTLDVDDLIASNGLIHESLQEILVPYADAHRFS